MIRPEKFGYPIGQTRLFSSIILSCFFVFFIFEFSERSISFTLMRQFYLIFGVLAGIALATIELKLVLPKLIENKETIVWHIIPASAIIFGLPLVLTIALFGVAEYLPFLAYVILSAIPSYLFVSGYFFTKFERANKVKVFAFIYGVKYWRNQLPDISENYYWFLRNVKLKDTTALWWQSGYSKRFFEKVAEDQNIDLSVRQSLLDILKVMNRFRKAALLSLFLFFVYGIFISILIFGGILGFKLLNIPVVDLVGPLSGLVFIFLIGFWAIISTFRRTISRLLSSLNYDKLPLT
jgi:hypothetical protein